MSQDSGYPSGSYWVGVHASYTGTIATAAVTEEDLQHLGVKELVDILPLTVSEYHELPDIERNRLSTDENIVLQPYPEFMERYEEHGDELTSGVEGLQPQNVIREHIGKDPSIVVRYLTDEGRAAREDWDQGGPPPSELGGYVDQTAFDDAVVLYGKSPERVEQADPGWDLINLQLGRTNHLLKELRYQTDNLSSLKSNTENIEGWAKSQEKLVQNLDQVGEILENASLQN